MLLPASAAKMQHCKELNQLSLLDHLTETEALGE